MVEVWFEHLRDVDFQAAAETAKKWTSTEERFPTPAAFMRLLRHKPMPELPELPPAERSPEAIEAAKARIAEARKQLARKS